MRPVLLTLALCTAPLTAQTPVTDINFLHQARTKYDAPFDRNLKSFTCNVDFSWKQHFTEAPRVGDEGTDEEISASPTSSRTICARRWSTSSASPGNLRAPRGASPALSTA